MKLYKRYDPPQFYVVRECHSPTQLVVYGAGGLERYVHAPATPEEVIAEFTPSWQWRPGDYKTSLKGWRTRAAAERKAAALAPYRARVYELMIDEDAGEEVDRLVECGAPDTGSS